MHGQKYDDDYRIRHADEADRWFPLHNKCNAEFDLVPAWVNPTVSSLAFLTATGAGMAVVTGVTRVWNMSSFSGSR
ncbi:hypothetical protein ACWEQO_26540 [Streptomyces sp. NPDC004051]